MNQKPTREKKTGCEANWKPRAPNKQTNLKFYIYREGAGLEPLEKPGSGGGDADGWWRRTARSSGMAILSCLRLIGDYRVLGCIAIAMLLVCWLVDFTWDRPAVARKLETPAAVRERDSSEEPIAQGKSVGEEMAPGPMLRIEDAPGEFLSDLQLAFAEGSGSVLVCLRDSDEESLFDSWRDVLAPDYSIFGLLLRKVATTPEGGDTYEIVDRSARISGFISVRRIEGRWRVVGVRSFKEQGKSGPNPKLLDLLETMRKTRAEEPAGTSPQSAGQIENQGGILSPGEVKRP